MEKILPPDPDGQNEDRAMWAEDALQAFMIATGSERDTALADLLCDLMHWADREKGASFESALNAARFHYEAETQETEQDDE